MTRCELVRTVAVANTLGEGILWNPRTNSAWWTDIQESRLFQYFFETDELRVFNTPYRVASLGFVKHSNNLVVAFDRGVALFTPESGAVEWLVKPGTLQTGLRFNDGKVDPRGRFWVGSMVENRRMARGSASLYCLFPGKGLVERISGLSISNGLCWSPEGDLMYHADSPRHSIQAYKYETETGELTEGRTITKTAPDAFPDGSTTDSEGGIWNAQWGSSQVVRYHAGGSPDFVLTLPVSQPSCLTFGGRDLSLLFVTSARDGLPAERLEAESEAGHMFIFETRFKGIPPTEFSRARAN